MEATGNNFEASTAGIAARVRAVKTRFPGIGKWYLVYKAVKYTAITAFILIK